MAGTAVNFPNYSPRIVDGDEAVSVSVKGGIGLREVGNIFTIYWQRH